ncbi:MAG: hypothetical protein AAGC78_10150 [Cellvibrio sp.]|uniref:InlB B-repeat-containing protein n=1 Tax=Cellvibrio sp. TaxID=1965322 RepID=UPI0031AF6461
MTFSRLRRLGTFSLLVGIGLMAQAALAGTLTNVSVTPADPAPGATTSYTFQYTVEQDVYQDEALLYVTFPSGFTVAGSGCSRITSITLNPDMGETASCAQSYGTGNTVGFTVTLSNGGSVIGDPVNTVVTVVVGGVTNPSVAGNYDFDPAGGINSSTGIYTTQFIDSGNPVFTEKDKAPKQTVAIGTPTAVNGACGVAHGKVVDASRLPPSSELCAVDVDFGYAEDATRVYWGCKGKNGGTDTAANACSATKGHLILAGPFPLDSGTASCSPNPVVSGGSSICTATPEPGYMFDNWSGDCTGASCVLTNVNTIKYIDANFVVAQYPVTTSVNPSTAGSVSCTSNPVTHGNNTTCTYTANPGYTFTSWSGDCTGATCALTNLTSAKSVTANFTAPTFTITVNTSGLGTASCTPNPVNGGSNSTCTATPSAGNTFTGWSGDCAGNSCVLTSVNANKAVTATFAPATFSISGLASPTVGGSVSCSGSISHGGNGSCSATANSGYAFSSWSGCPSANGSSCSFTNVTANRSVTANFTANTYTVTASANPTQAGSASCVSPVTHGGDSSCTAKATTGYKFSSWSGACTGSDCFITNVTGNSTAVANFVLIPTYNVSTSVSPLDSGKITCSKDIIEGGTGTCTAKANPGYRFTSWGGDCSGNTNCSLENVTGAKSVNATFEVATSFRITAYLQWFDGTYQVEDLDFYDALDCSHSNPVSINSTVTCMLPDSSLESIGGYRFIGWSGDCSRVEGGNCIIDNITTDKHINIRLGYPERSGWRIKVLPAGAGSIWCHRYDSLNVSSLSASIVRQECIAEANPGYAFTSFTDGSDGNSVYVNFTKQADTPVVTCTDCNNSTLSTDTTTTQVVSKTSEPDAQGNTTQSTVAITTDTEKRGSSTTVQVSSQDANGVIEFSTGVVTNNSGIQGSVIGNTVIVSPIIGPSELSGSVVASPDKVTTTVENNGQKVAEVNTSSGQTAAVNATETGITVGVTDTATGTTLGTTTVSGDTTTTASADGSTLVRNAARGDSAATSTFYGAGTVISSSVFGNSSVTTTQGFGGLGSSATMNIASSQTSSIISGAISGGFVSAGTGGFTPATNSGGGFSGSNVSAQVTASGVSAPNQKAGLQKTSAADDNAQAAIDITGGTLQSVQLYSDSTGLVEFFKPGADANSPQMTAFESTETSFSITLSYPAK